MLSKGDVLARGVVGSGRANGASQGGSHGGAPAMSSEQFRMPEQVQQRIRE
jgi:hypothetical protein